MQQKSIAARLCLALLSAALASACFGQLTGKAGEIEKKLETLRSLSDSDRARETKQLALQIRALPKGDDKRDLAMGLANLSTEGDFGRSTLQAVTDTLVLATQETAPQPRNGQIPMEYTELAQLALYEHMKVVMVAPAFRDALIEVRKVDEARKAADFTLTDIEGKTWTLSALHGKVVLVNFWATWCPPCRKEMPDMETLYSRFKDQGFVVLAISNEEMSKVKPFIQQKGYNFPVLLDPGNKVNLLYSVDGIPKSFVYDRDGKLVAQAMDMRTQGQMLAMLAKAGLK